MDRASGGHVELALIVQDPDVPQGKPATHGLTIGIDQLVEGEAGLEVGGVVQGVQLEGVRVGPCERIGIGPIQPRRPSGPRPWLRPGTRLGSLQAFSGRPPTAGGSPRSPATSSVGACLGGTYAIP
ncbi:hypothetical protein ACFV9C_11115 [Kribbella sp. NPDC059898]|uniref:hypothetical protein n=1 Tax=Kribbella sp. NPDC059898 TaxID=3346995 RepID=UPI003656DB09